MGDFGALERQAQRHGADPAGWAALLAAYRQAGRGLEGVHRVAELLARAGGTAPLLLSSVLWQSGFGLGDPRFELSGPCVAAASSPDGALLAVADGAGSLETVRLPSLAPVARRALGGSPEALFFTQRGTRLVAFCTPGDEPVVVTAREEPFVEGLRLVTATARGPLICGPGGRHVLAAGLDGTFWHVDLEAFHAQDAPWPSPRQKSVGGGARLVSGAVAPDGAHAAVVFDDADGDTPAVELADLRADGPTRRIHAPGPAHVHVSFSPDSRLLAVVTCEHVPSHWDVPVGGRDRRTLAVFTAEGERLGESEIEGWAWAPVWIDGEAVAGTCVFDPETRRFRTRDGPVPEPNPFVFPTAHGVVSGRGRIWEFAPRKGDPAHVPREGPVATVEQVLVSDDGRRASALTVTGERWTWDLATGRAVGHPEAASPAPRAGGKAAPEGPSAPRQALPLSARVDEHGAVAVTETESGRLRLRVQPENGPARGLAWLPDGKTLLYGEGAHVRRLDVETPTGGGAGAARPAPSGTSRPRRRRR